MAVAKGTMLETLKINSSSKDDPPRPGGAWRSSSHPSVPYLFIYPTIYPSIYPSIYLYISTTISLFLFLFLSLSLFLFLFLPLSIYLSPKPFDYISVYDSIYHSIHQSIHQSIRRSIPLPPYIVLLNPSSTIHSVTTSLYHHTECYYIPVSQLAGSPVSRLSARSGVATLWAPSSGSYHPAGCGGGGEAGGRGGGGVDTISSSQL